MAALIPDADVLIHSPGDPLLTLEYHRHFSHALFSAPIIAVVLAALYRLGPGRGIPFSRLTLVLTAAALTAGLLDLCTSYGVHLLWPFVEKRFALNVIAVVDPLMTALVLSGLLLFKLLGRKGAVTTPKTLSGLGR